MPYYKVTDTPLIEAKNKECSKCNIIKSSLFSISAHWLSPYNVHIKRVNESTTTTYSYNKLDTIDRTYYLCADCFERKSLSKNKWNLIGTMMTFAFSALIFGWFLFELFRSLFSDHKFSISFFSIILIPAIVLLIYGIYDRRKLLSAQKNPEEMDNRIKAILNSYGIMFLYDEILHTRNTEKIKIAHWLVWTDYTPLDELPKEVK